MKNTDNFYKIDYARARGMYPKGLWYRLLYLTEYRPAFITTNEDLRNMIPSVGNVRGDVLTVAASGDQPMAYKTLGARSIDTFDITFSAKTIMDLKTAALQQMSYVHYKDFLINLFDENPEVRTSRRDMTRINGLSELIEKMPADSAEYLRKMSDCNIFSASVTGIQLPTADEYEKLRAVVKGPFNFIWTDITDLHKRVFKTYDIVNVSNILEWINPEFLRRVTSNLFNLLKPNGRILATTGNMNSWTRDVFLDFEKENEDIARVDIKRTQHDKWCLNILQRMY